MTDIQSSCITNFIMGNNEMKMRGGLFTKSNDKDIYYGFSVLYSIFCGFNIKFDEQNEHKQIIVNL